MNASRRWQPFHTPARPSGAGAGLFREGIASEEGGPRDCPAPPAHHSPKRMRKRGRGLAALGRVPVAATFALGCCLLLGTTQRLAGETAIISPAGPTLPNTAGLKTDEELDVKIVDGAHRFLDRKLTESVAMRERFYRREQATPEAYSASLEPNRERLRESIGLIDPRVTTSMQRWGDATRPALVAETSTYRVHQVRWPVLDGVDGEGLLLEPVGREPVGTAIVLPDADQTPEQLTGLTGGVQPSSQMARRLAENGFRVVVPVLVNRECTYSGNPRIAMTNQPHREWIYRQAFEMGRHVIGYEVQKVLAVVDWLKGPSGLSANAMRQADEDSGEPLARDRSGKLAVVGYGEGGLLALYAAAIDTRIDACVCSGYFTNRQEVWREPIYRNVWRLLREFGDAELASLVVPRPLVIEHSRSPKVEGPPPEQKGRRNVAAPGKLTTPEAEAVKAELARAGTLDPKGFGPRHLVIGLDDQPVAFGSVKALRAIADSLGIEADMSLSDELPRDRRSGFDPQQRQKRQVEQLVRHVQRAMRLSDHVRRQRVFDKLSRNSVDAFVADARPLREFFRNDVIGSFDERLLPPNPRSRKIHDEPDWVGYEVVLDVWPDVWAWGILCVPKDIEAGQRRPVVVCQHGLEGLPQDAVELNETERAYRYYKGFAAELAQRGFVTFSPFNLYRGKDRFRTLQRKLNPLGCTLFSIITPQHQQILNYLGSLPFVDPERIGFYGLSYGGKSAMRIPALLEGYCLSICSGDFDDWIRKNVTVDARYSYMFTGEWEIFEFNLGRTFNYAEMSYLIAPRPFMVERGHHDGVAPDEWVAYEYAKVRWMYTQLGLSDRTEIEYFDGPHAINAEGTFDFLHKHLDWPKPAGN